VEGTFNKNTLYLLRLQSVPGRGAWTLHKILRWANGDAERLEALFSLDDAELRRTFGLKP